MGSTLPFSHSSSPHIPLPLSIPFLPSPFHSLRPHSISPLSFLFHSIPPLQGFGDSGQGLFNGIIFVLFCHKVRFHLSQRCRQCLCCRGSLKGVMSHHGDHHTFYGSYSSDNRRSEDREASDESSDAASMTNAPHKSLLLNT